MTLTFESDQDSRNTAGILAKLFGVTLNLADEDGEIFATVEGEVNHQVTVKPNPDRGDDQRGLC